MTSSPESFGALAVHGVSHRFNDLLVLDAIDLSVHAGEFVAIVGPSGCGKTTLLRAVAGLITPASGSARLDDIDLLGKPGSVAYLPQNDSLLPWRRALDNATVGAEVAGVDRDVARRRATELFEQFGLAGFETAWPHELSGGMRQRVALLRAFLLNQTLLVLDEPFGSLDALTRSSMQRWLEGVWATDHRTTLLVTHDVDEALLLADRLLVMSERPGHIVNNVIVDLPRPRHPFTTTLDQFVSLKRQVVDALVNLTKQ